VKIVLALVLVMGLTIVFVYQDASAMTILFEDEFDGQPLLVPSNAAIFADDFELVQSSNTIIDAHFFMEDPSNDFNDIVFFTLYSDSGGQPGAIIDSGTGIINMPPMPNDLGVGCSFCFEVWMDLPPPGVPLSAGTYWFGITSPVPWSLVFDDTPELLPLQFSFNDGFSWIESSGFGLPFQITGPSDDEEDGGQLVGGEYLTIDTAALLLAGMQTNLAWIVPVALSAVGIGVILVRKKF